MAGSTRNVATFAIWHKPDFTKVVRTNPQFKSNFNSATLYAHYEMSYSDLKKEVVKYAKKHNLSQDTQDSIKSIHENKFAVLGKYLFVLNHGGEVPEDIEPRLLPLLDDIIESAKRKIQTKSAVEPDSAVATEKPEYKVNVQERLREKAKFVAGEIDEWIDNLFTDVKNFSKSVDDFVRLFKEHELKAAHMVHMQSLFEKKIAEINELSAGDKQLLEAYSFLSKPDIKKIAGFFSNLMSACDMIKEVARAERTPKKRKPVSVEKLISKLKYKKDESTLGLASVNPSTLLGAKEVWVYNVKTRKISKYVADDLQGPISVKGTTLVGYDESKSVTKTLRKPKEQLDQFKKSSKVQLRTYLKTISTVETIANGRMNEDTIILRADK